MSLRPSLTPLGLPLVAPVLLDQALGLTIGGTMPKPIRADDLRSILSSAIATKRREQGL